MSVSLKKGSSMSLTEMENMAYNDNSALIGAGMLAGAALMAGMQRNSQLQYAVGLGWDVNRHGASMDLDAWALAVDFNENKHMVYYGDKKDPTRNIVHTGDNLTGAGDGDDETINIDLGPLTDKYKYILLGVTIYGAKRKNQSFANVKNAFVRVYDRATKVELCKYSDSFSREYANCTTLVFGAFINDNGTWRFKAVGQSVNQCDGIGDIARLLAGAALLSMVNTPDNSCCYDNSYGDNNTNVNNNSNGGKKHMAVSLSKGGKVSLAKVAADAGIQGLSKIVVGLGWDTNRYDGGAAFDLDAAAFMLGANGKVRGEKDFIFYNNKVGDGVEHTGDNRTGEGEGDDEQIKINLTAIPADVDKVSFTVTIDQADVRNQNFGMVENAFIRIVDEATNTELVRYDLSEDFSVETAVVVAELYRHSGEWKFNAIGSGFAGGLGALCNNFGIQVE